jgi:hypothetical protein
MHQMRTVRPRSGVSESSLPTRKLINRYCTRFLGALLLSILSSIPVTLRQNKYDFQFGCLGSGRQLFVLMSTSFKFFCPMYLLLYC